MGGRCRSVEGQSFTALAAYPPACGESEATAEKDCAGVEIKKTRSFRRAPLASAQGGSLRSIALGQDDKILPCVKDFFGRCAASGVGDS
jgi:hypothetical protein